MNFLFGFLIDIEYEVFKYFMYIFKKFKDKIKDKGCY